MNKTKIEWVKNPDGSQGYTLNSKSGCTNHTPEGLCLGGLFPCYAFKLANTRLRERYLANGLVACDYDGGEEGSDASLKVAFADPFYPRWWPERLWKPYQTKKPSGLFLDDMSDWMLDCWPEKWTETELEMMRDNPQHRFYTLTKQPQNLIKFSPFPDNCWVGVTATNPAALRNAMFYLDKVEAKVKYISMEPLLEDMKGIDEYEPDISEVAYALSLSIINWLIIGAQTKPYKPPKIEWVREIVEAADKAGIPVFLKDNLKPLLRGRPEFWDEIPQGDHPNYESIAILRREMPSIPSE